MRIAILTTGGTIEKTYNESDGTIANVGSVLHHILGSLRHPNLEIRHIPVMSILGPMFTEFHLLCLESHRSKLS